MTVRLCLLEDKLNPIFERYSFLYRAQSLDVGTSLEDLKSKQHDAYLSIILGILDLRIDMLRLQLTIQENPAYIGYAATRLVKKANHYKQLWADISRGPSLIEFVAIELKQTIDDMNWWQKSMPDWLVGERSRRLELEAQASHFEKQAEELRNQPIELTIAKELSDKLGRSLLESKPSNLIYWRDELGEHSYYTSDIELLPVLKN